MVLLLEFLSLCVWEKLIKWMDGRVFERNREKGMQIGALIYGK